MGRKKKRNKKKSAQGGQSQVSKKNNKRKRQGGRHQQTDPQQLIAPAQSQALTVAPEIKPVAETTFSKKLEEAIAQSEGKKQLFGGKIILLGAPANLIINKWKGFWRHFRAGLRKFGLIFLVLAALAAILTGLEAFSHDRVFPRVVIAGHDYSYNEISRARDSLLEALNQYEQRSLTFVMDPDNIDYGLTLADWQMEKHMNKEAKEVLGVITEHWPDNVDAREMLKKLLREEEGPGEEESPRDKSGDSPDSI